MYQLPASRIAQRSTSYDGKRSDSRLLHLQHADGAYCLVDRCFENFSQLLRSGDLLVLNDTAVLPHRFFARCPRRDAEVEILLLEKLEDLDRGEVWEAVGRPLKKLLEGQLLELTPELHAKVLGRTEDLTRIKLELFTPGENLQGVEKKGVMPIPPYIRGGRADGSDSQCYQTVFAKNEGSIAAPTAGLHFTERIIAEVKEAGIGIAHITLHVGLPSITPLREEQLGIEELHAECYRVPPEVREQLVATKRSGGRVIAVGTTVVRALESWGQGELASVSKDGVSRANASREGDVVASEEFVETRIFIKPGHQFTVVDAMLTNFHQPESSHLMLVAAFAGEEVIQRAYQHALEGDYRFLSYGDAMFVEGKSGFIEGKSGSVEVSSSV